MPQAETSTSVRAVTTGEAALLARRYAAALYELAEESKHLDAVAADLSALPGWLAESAEFRAFTADPRLTKDVRVKAAAALASAAKLQPLTGRFLGLLAQNSRLDLLNAIVAAFMAELASRRGETTADVRSAGPLTPQQQEKLAAGLQSLAGGKVHMNVREDKSLIGGLVIKLGSRLIDASVKNRLARMERQLKIAK